jgi:hypothetical protein
MTSFLAGRPSRWLGRYRVFSLAILATAVIACASNSPVRVGRGTPSVPHVLNIDDIATARHVLECVVEQDPRLRALVAVEGGFDLFSDDQARSLTHTVSGEFPPVSFRVEVRQGEVCDDEVCVLPTTVWIRSGHQASCAHGCVSASYVPVESGGEEEERIVRGVEACALRISEEDSPRSNP